MLENDWNSPIKTISKQNVHSAAIITIECILELPKICLAATVSLWREIFQKEGCPR